MTYFTHWCLAASGVLVALLAVSTSVTWVAYCFGVPCVSGGGSGTPQEPPGWRLGGVEMATACLSVALFSVQLGLTLSTLSLFAAYDGSLVASENGWREAGFEFSLQHSISFFFAAAMYGSRFELAERCGTHKKDVDRLPAWARRLCYYAPPVIMLLCWLATVASSAEGSPYDKSTSPAPFAVGIAASVVPWIVTGFEI